MDCKTRSDKGAACQRKLWIRRCNPSRGCTGLIAVQPRPPPSLWGRRGAGRRSRTPPTARGPKTRRNYKDPRGLLNKVSTVNKEKAAKETGEKELLMDLHYFASTTASLCYSSFTFSSACLTFVVHMFWRLRTLTR